MSKKERDVLLSNCSKIQKKKRKHAELQRCGGISIFTSSYLRSWYSYPWEHAECVLLIHAWCCQELDELFITGLYFLHASLGLDQTQCIIQVSGAKEQSVLMWGSL